MTIIYPVGIPTLFAVLLWKSSDADALQFIEAAYEPSFFWWEIAELSRKLLLTTITVFFVPDTASQIIAVLLVAFFFLVLLRSFNPYLAADDDLVAAGAQVGLVLTSLGALCAKVEVTSEDSWSTASFDVILTGVLASVPLMALLFVLVEAGVIRPWCCGGGQKKAVSRQ